MDRVKLYERIDQRVDKMFEMGLVKEVENLRKIGFDKSTVSMQGIGYKEVLGYLDCRITIDEAVNLIKKGTRNYAKRQMTWFKKIEDVYWIDVEKQGNVLEIVENINNYIASTKNFL